MFTITQLNIYPVKSLAGIAMQEAKTTERGFEHDRRWMLIDANNQFLTQRKFGAMALLETEIADNHLLIRHKLNTAYGTLQVPLQTDGYAQVKAQIWDDVCRVLLCSKEADFWLSEVLESPIRLAYIPDDSPRQVEPERVKMPMNVSLSDGYPYLLIGEKSLEDLNQRLEYEVPMERFRPNLVFSGAAAYQEDSWKDMLIGGISFRGVKPCGRCILTTTDQQTGLRHSGGEPLKTLASYRSQGNKVLFGMNLIVLGDGIVRVGDELLPIGQ